MLAPVGYVLGVWDVLAIWKWKLAHVLAASARRSADDLAIAFEDESGHLLESPIVEVLHDLDNRLFAFADSDEVELIDERVGLA
jgi:hypothetical protein